MPPKKKQKRMPAATDRETRSKSPVSEVGSLIQEAPEIEAIKEAMQKDIQEAAQEDIQEITEEGCTEERGGGS